MRNSPYTKPLIWNFNATELLDIPIKDTRKALQLRKMLKNLRQEEIGLSYDQNIVCSDNPNISNKVKKSGKIGQDQKFLESIFANFLTAPSRHLPAQS